MCKRFLFDNIISLIGAWTLFIITGSLYYVIWAIYEYYHQKKYSIGQPLTKILKEELYELKLSYWMQ